MSGVDLRQDGALRGGKDLPVPVLNARGSRSKQRAEIMRRTLTSGCSNVSVHQS